MVFIINYITRHMRCYIADAVCEVICFKASAQRKPGVLGEETCVTSTAWSSRAGGHGCEPAFLMFEVMAALSAFPAATADNTWGQKRLIWFLCGVKCWVCVWITVVLSWFLYNSNLQSLPSMRPLLFISHNWWGDQTTFKKSFCTLSHRDQKTCLLNSFLCC